MAMKVNKKLYAYKAYDFDSAKALMVRCPAPYNFPGAEIRSETVGPHVVR